MAREIPHGTVSGYRRHKCRCDSCKAASAAAFQRYKAAKIVDADQIPHGTINGYRHYKCRCSECKSASAAEGRRYREANREAEKERKRQWREGNPEKLDEQLRRYRESHRELYVEIRRRYAAANRDKVREREREARAANPEQFSERSRRYRKAHPDKINEGFNRWAEANPERLADIRRLANSRRRARQRSAFVEDIPRLEIFERDRWQCMIPGCLYPGVPASLDVERNSPLLASIDHVIPLSKGGLHERSNVVCSHLRCNSVKTHRIEGIA